MNLYRQKCPICNILLIYFSEELEFEDDKKFFQTNNIFPKEYDYSDPEINEYLQDPTRNHLRDNSYICQQCESLKYTSIEVIYAGLIIYDQDLYPFSYFEETFIFDKNKSKKAEPPQIRIVYKEDGIEIFQTSDYGSIIGRGPAFKDYLFDKSDKDEVMLIRNNLFKSIIDKNDRKHVIYSKQLEKYKLSSEHIFYPNGKFTFVNSLKIIRMLKNISIHSLMNFYNSKEEEKTNLVF